MELRYGQLLREQERLVQEMERAVSKQETIKFAYVTSKACNQC